LEYQASGKPELALQNYKLALQANPQLAEVYVNMSKIAIDAKDFSLARDYAKKAVDLFQKNKRPSVDGSTWEKACSLAYQNLGSAETMLAIDDEDFDLLALGMQHIEKSVELDPDNTEAHNLLSKLQDVAKEEKSSAGSSNSESPEAAECRQAFAEAVQKYEAADQAMDQAKTVLARYTAIFNPADTHPNPIFAKALCNTFDGYTSGVDCSPETRQVINNALQGQIAKTEPYRKYAEYHAKQAESEKKWNHAAEYQQQVAKYWQARHNLDYFSTYAYLDTLVKEQLLEISIREMALRLHELDVATYGYLTTEKVDRIKEGMSLAQVENIVGPGRAVGSFDYNDGPIKLKLDKYEWISKDGSGMMTCAFDHKSLYSKSVTWN
jgi:hypothetical protein